MEIDSKAWNNSLDLDGKNFTLLHSSSLLLLLCFSSPSLIARMPDLVSARSHLSSQVRLRWPKWMPPLRSGLSVEN